ncbi:MAG: hypothetical protein M3361_20560, partial [Candidatus Tectomicrobia bacterium]|nr:hypothetical protein [Candidatus Tectomicrobia bacterium]
MARPYLDFSGERLLPPMSKLLEQPYWLDPSGPHRMAAAMQIKTRPLAHNYAVASGDWRHDLVEREGSVALAIRGRAAGPSWLGQAARPNTWCTKARWPGMLLPGTPRTCPLASI